MWTYGTAEITALYYIQAVYLRAWFRYSLVLIRWIGLLPSRHPCLVLRRATRQHLLLDLDF